MFPPDSGVKGGEKLSNHIKGNSSMKGGRSTPFGGNTEYFARLPTSPLCLFPTGQPEVVYLLLNAGLNPRQKDSYGQVITCLHYV